MTETSSTSRSGHSTPPVPQAAPVPQAGAESLGLQSEPVVQTPVAPGDAGPRGLALSQYFATVQQPELRIDVVRATWNDQMADTERLLGALAAAAAAQVPAQVPAHVA